MKLYPLLLWLLARASALTPTAQASAHFHNQSNASLSSHLPSLVVSSLPCSGRGTLDAKNQCVCDTGYSGEDEFYKFNDCHIQDRIFIGFYLASIALIGLVVLRCLLTLSLFFGSMARRRWIVPKRVKGFHMLHLLFACAAIARLVCGVFRMRTYEWRLLPTALLAVATAAVVSSFLVLPLLWWHNVQNQLGVQGAAAARTRRRIYLAFGFGILFLWVTMLGAGFAAVYMSRRGYLLMGHVGPVIYVSEVWIFVVLTAALQFYMRQGTIFRVRRLLMAGQGTGQGGPRRRSRSGWGRITSETGGDTTAECGGEAETSEISTLSDPGRMSDPSSGGVRTQMRSLRKIERRLVLANVSLVVVTFTGACVLPFAVFVPLLRRHTYILFGATANLSALYVLYENYIWTPRPNNKTRKRKNKGTRRARMEAGQNGELRTLLSDEDADQPDTVELSVNPDLKSIFQWWSSGDEITHVTVGGSQGDYTETETDYDHDYNYDYDEYTSSSDSNTE